MAQVFEDGDEVHFSILEDQLLNFMSEIEARKSVERTAAQKSLIEDKLKHEIELTACTSYIKGKEGIRELEAESFKFSEMMKSLSFHESIEKKAFEKTYVQVEALRREYVALHKILLKNSEKKMKVAAAREKSREVREQMGERIQSQVQANQHALFQLQDEQKFLGLVLQHLGRICARLSSRSIALEVSNNNLARENMEQERRLAKMKLEFAMRRRMAQSLRMMREKKRGRVVEEASSDKMMHVTRGISRKEQAIQVLRSVDKTAVNSRNELGDLERAVNNPDHVQLIRSQIQAVTMKWMTEKANLIDGSKCEFETGVASLARLEADLKRKRKNLPLYAPAVDPFSSSTLSIVIAVLESLLDNIFNY